MMLFLLNGSTVSEFSFVKRKELAQGVFRILLRLDAVNSVDAVMKQKRRYRLNANVKNTVETSVIGKETMLHSYLHQLVPEHIVPLIFSNVGQFTYVKSNKFLTPVKITVFCQKDSLRSNVKLAQCGIRDAIATVFDALKLYDENRLCDNTDWLQVRNILFVNGKCLFYDFDSCIEQ